MIPDIDRTIVALGSSPEGARRAIIRLSGPATLEVIARLLTVNELPQCPGRQAASSFVSRLQWDDAAPQLPVRVILWPGVRSYTGQPSAEIHVLGCPPIAQQIIARACQLGADLAERGEFTLRAFLSGKLDLAQAEGVLGVIEANSEDELRTALEQLGGNLAPRIRPLRDEIVDLLAHLEAGLDFVEEDIEFISSQRLASDLETIRNTLLRFEESLCMRSSSNRMPRVVLVGEPNAGKSSLLNALSRQERAIVSPVAGTTRDYLTARIAIDNQWIELVDTAGIESISEETPRGMAQQQLEFCVDNSDLVLLCIAGPALERADNQAIQPLIQFVRKRPKNRHLPIAWVVTKSDLIPKDTQSDWLALIESVHRDSHDESAGGPVVFTSVVNQEGLSEIQQQVKLLLAAQVEPLALVHQTALRCQSSVRAAIEGIERAIQLTHDEMGEELVAGELRIVLDDLSSIIGEVHSDDILGEIFGRFCIGK